MPTETSVIWRDFEIMKWRKRNLPKHVSARLQQLHGENEFQDSPPNRPSEELTNGIAPELSRERTRHDNDELSAPAAGALSQTTNPPEGLGLLSDVEVRRCCDAAGAEHLRERRQRVEDA